MSDWCLPAGNGIGDVCEEDFDGDGVINSMDTDPNNSKMQRTDFSDPLIVAIDPTNRRQIRPIWRVSNNVSIREGTDVMCVCARNAVAFIQCFHCVGH